RRQYPPLYRHALCLMIDALSRHICYLLDLSAGQKSNACSIAVHRQRRPASTARHCFSRLENKATSAENAP
ncbi:MAG TPA: hypothetical protein VF050_08780, partial [Moraxellaceae bacterium]